MAGRGGFFKSIGDFLSGLFGRESEPPADEYPEPTEPVPAQEFWEPPEVYEPVPGVDIGPFDRSETFEHIIEDVGVDDDPYAVQLVWDGWFRDDNTADERAEARAMFFDYEGIEDYDFPWDEWREWYDSQ